jgi:hypothetical protein
MRKIASLYSSLAAVSQRIAVVKERAERSLSGPPRPQEILKWSEKKGSLGNTALEE